MKARNYIKTACFISIFLTGIIACTEDEKFQPNQQIYFEHYEINYAWGLNYVHWIIDDKGNVRLNKKKDSLVWINYNELNNSIRYFDSVVYKIDEPEFRKYVSLIEAASKGKIDSIHVIRADFGTTVYNCFWYNISGSQNKRIVISRMSDLGDEKNLDSKAIEIDSWLKNINSIIYSGIH
jgi:hypothetical protein